VKLLLECAGRCVPTQRLRVFFMDEARFGQQGTTTRVWAERGSRPSAVKQTRYEWVYLYAAVEPATGASVALQAPSVNTQTMNVFLKMLSAELGPSEQGVLIMDQAGWHKSKKLRLPENIHVLFLPPYSPELNPVERLWAYLRQHYLSNRVFDGYQHLLDAGAEAWQQLTPELLRSVCRCDYLPRVEVW
jgi:transposase